ncbi:MAG: sulfur carrier protein ThiS [Campylobacteraceae bacterium]|jgi:sulfur carrier protein|nr:sulfur carrier protein ThiS [Campylobacteraceae bacterium]
MILFVNGEQLESGVETIGELIKELQIEGKVMAAAVNMNVVKQANWTTYKLKENDKVELLRFVGGG